jgi:hypothetical protein
MSVDKYTLVIYLPLGVPMSNVVSPVLKYCFQMLTKI